MAHAALGPGVRDLAERAAASPETVVRLEQGAALRDRTLAAIRLALEAAGIDFIPENRGGVGVRLPKADRATDSTAPPGFVDTVSTALDSLPGKVAGGGDDSGNDKGH